MNKIKTFPLDIISTQSVGAYSLKLLTKKRKNRPIINVRRASDNATRDIFHTPDGNLDIYDLQSFTSGTSGFVNTWYDQSGNGNNFTQGTAATQPAITNGATVITNSNSPILYFNGSNYFTGGNILNLSSGANFSVVTSYITSTQGSVFFGKYNAIGSWANGNIKIGLYNTTQSGNTAGQYFGSVQFSGGWTVGNVIMSNGSFNVCTYYGPTGGSNNKVYTNGSLNTNQLTATENATNGGSVTTIGYGLSDGMTHLNGYMGSMFLFQNTITDSDRKQLELYEGLYYGSNSIVT